MAMPAKVAFSAISDWTFCGSASSANPKEHSLRGPLGLEMPCVPDFDGRVSRRPGH
jgi:hypothetical protein